jgi:ribosomal protein S18 acetylase RimI-like enzyme
MIEGISLREEVPDDKEFLAALYASTRSEEMKLTPWDEAQKRDFLRQQFELQTRHYRSFFGDARFAVILGASGPIGRLYVQRTQKVIHVIDIALVPEHRGKGVGASLLKSLQDEGASSGKPVEIYVEMNNPALRLYTRLGFQPIETHGIYILMRWFPGLSTAAVGPGERTPGASPDKAP